MTTLNLQVGASNGDGRMAGIANDAGRAVGTGAGVSNITETILSPGSHANNDEWSAGARFTSVTIANAATINSATFILTAQSTYNAGANVVKYWVSAHASDNSGVLVATGGSLNTTNRPRTTAVSAGWTQTSVTANTEYSIDVTSVVQEIVNRAGWASGNALTIIVDTHADTTLNEWQDYHAYDGDTARAPKLNIDYTAGGGTKAPPFRRQRKQIRFLRRWY